MSIEKAHSKTDFKSKHAIACQKESCGERLKHEKLSSSDHIVSSPQGQMNDPLQKIEATLAATQLSNISMKWIMFSMISLLLISFLSDWKKSINMLMEIAFVICLLTTVFLLGLVGKYKQSIAALETHIDKMQSKIDIIQSENKAREAQYVTQEKRLLDKLNKKKQKEMELENIAGLSDNLKFSKASTTSVDGSCTFDGSCQGSPRKHTVSEGLAEMNVDTETEAQDLRRSKIILAENASVLIEDLRKGLRELSTPTKVKPN